MTRTLSTTGIEVLMIILDIAGILIAYHRTKYFKDLGLAGLSSYKAFCWMFSTIALAFFFMLLVNIFHLANIIQWTHWVSFKLVLFKTMCLIGMVGLGYSLEEGSWYAGRRRKN